MLTIHPNFTNYVKPAVSFKAGEYDATDEYYQKKVNYYKQQAKDFEKLAQDAEAPKGLSTMMKIFQVASQALLEGWAVAWGASKGSKILKSSFIKGANSKFSKNTKEVLKPIGEGAKNSWKKITEIFGAKAEKVKNSKFAQKLNSGIEKLKNNKYGKYLVQGFEYVKDAFKYVGSWISQGFKKVTEPLKNKPAEEIYDKAAKVTSTTLGVGAGAAGAYDAAINKKQEVVEEYGE